jgi:hypothetical protein
MWRISAFIVFTKGSEMNNQNHSPEAVVSFYEQPHVKVETIPVGDGVLIGSERVFNPKIGIGGAYGTWGPGYDNEALADVLRSNLGEAFSEEDRMDLSQLGFVSRHDATDRYNRNFIAQSLMKLA